MQNMQTCVITLDSDVEEYTPDSFSSDKQDTVPLIHSQSPSFADIKTPVKQKRPKNGKKRMKLVIRDAQKRQKPLALSPIKSEPEPKRAKKDSVEVQSESFLSDYHCEIVEVQARMDKILCSPIDMFEMYQTLRQSASVIPCPRPLLFPQETTASEDVSKRCRWEENDPDIDDRLKAVENLFSTRNFLDVSVETLHLAVGILDQCLERMLVDKRALKDLSAVSLVIASKVEEVNCIQLYAILDCGLVAESLEQEEPRKMIRNLERLVLNTLNYEVTFPTPLTFATYLLVQLHASPSTINLTHYMLELSLTYMHNRMSPSDVVAHAATCLGFAMDSKKTSSSSDVSLLEAELNLQDFSKIKVADNNSRDVMRVLADLFELAAEENNVFYIEYSSPRRHSVALRRIDSSLQKILNID